MAGHSPAQGARTGPAAGRLILLLAAALAACAPDAFSLRGSVTAAARLQKRVEKPNMVMLIVATNEKGVPVAVRRVVNPRLPLEYAMGPEDLILPGPAWHGPLSVQVHVNRHGKLGETKRGDLRGTQRGMARAGERHANVVIDEIL